MYLYCLHQLDKQVEESIVNSTRPLEMLNYCKKLALADQPMEDDIEPLIAGVKSKIVSRTATRILLPRHFKSELLRLIVQLYSQQSPPDFPAMCQCLLFLGDTEGVASVMSRLITDNTPGSVSHLIAYQIAFDIVESSPQFFLDQLQTILVFFLCL